MTVDGDNGVPSSVAALADGLRRQCGVVTLNKSGDGWAVEFVVDLRSDPVYVDASHLEDSDSVTLIERLSGDMPKQRNHIRPVIVQGSIIARGLDFQATGMSRVWVEATSGTIRIASKKQCAVRVLQDARCNIELTEGSYELSVESAGASVSAGDMTEVGLITVVPRLVVSGSVSLDVKNHYVEELLVDGGKATLKLVAPTLQVGRLASSNGKPDLAIEAAAETNDRECVIVVKSVGNVLIRNETLRRVTVQVSESATGLSLGGDVDLHLVRADADDICAIDGKVRLFASYSFVRDMAGAWTMGRASGSQLRGGDGGFEILEADAECRFEEAVVIDFDVVPGRDGRRVLEALKDAYQVVPRRDRVPGMGTLRWYRGLIPAHELAHINRDAEFVGELARRAREGHAPGAVRTHIGWCAYRLRHLSSNSGWERTTLMAYRALGYGERPGPALLTWIAISFLAAIVLLVSQGFGMDASWAGVTTLVLETIKQAVSPLGALTSTGGPDATALQHAIRVLVAIPLLTGALALRNFVKQDR